MDYHGILSRCVSVLQVLSPLTSLVLAERSIRVLDDKVSVTELGVQLVSGLALSLQLSPGSNKAIVATATTQEVIESLEQVCFQHFRYYSFLCITQEEAKSDLYYCILYCAFYLLASSGLFQGYYRVYSVH